MGAGKPLQQELLDPSRAAPVGGIHRMDCQGMSRIERDDDEILLLRVEGTAALSMENELLAVR
ncbi:MAG: hypothetical protein ACRD0K_31030 [Egibacteraceae bacterium]